MAQRTLSIPVVPGDGIGQEVMPPALRALDLLAKQSPGRFAFTYQHFP